MTIMTSRGGRNLTLKRRTAFMLDATPAAAVMAPDRQPPTASIIEVKLQGGTSNTGTVTVSGTVNGSPDSEVLTFTAAGTKRTVKRFTAISGLTSTGLDDEAAVPTVAVRALGAAGETHYASYDVATGIVGHLERGTTNAQPVLKSGGSEKERTWIGIDYDASQFTTVREGDVFIDEDSLEQWFVVSDTDWLGGRRPHHWEIDVTRREGSV